MAHTHQVVDSDIRFVINPITRAITRADAKKSSLVVGDHNSERFTFEIPKTVEGHDMSLCNVIRIHYLNTSSENKSVQSLGVYEVDDFGPDSEDENTMKFTWLISRKATQHVGPLAFTIQFACMTGFKVDYSWQSGIFSGITVSNAVNATEVVIDEYADILQQWWEQLYASSELPISVMPFNDFEELNGDTQNGMLYLLSDDPAVEDLEKIPSIEQSVLRLDTQYAQLDEEVDTYTERIENVEARTNALSTQYAQLDETVESHTEQIPKIEERVYDIGETCRQLGVYLSTAESKIQDLEEFTDTIASEVRTDIPSIYAKKDDLTAGNIEVIAKNAECDGKGDNIAQTYMKKADRPVIIDKWYMSTKITSVADSLDNRILLGTFPNNKYLHELHSIGIRVHVINEARDIDKVLQFSGVRADLPVDISGSRPGVDILPFKMTATGGLTGWDGGDFGFEIGYMELDVCKDNGNLYLEFSELTSYGKTILSRLAIGENPDQAELVGTKVEKLDEGHFYLDYAYCYFA